MSDIRSLKGKSFLHASVSRANAQFLFMDRGRLSIVPYRSKAFHNICAHWDHALPGAPQSKVMTPSLLHKYPSEAANRIRNLSQIGEEKKKKEASLVLDSEVQSLPDIPNLSPA